MSQRREPKLYDFYCCYLLRSVPKQKSFYIGSTPDPVRRLRQHNGDLVSGAYKTKRNGFRPWKACMMVYGFPTKVSALMFEHAWQHPYQTRHIKVSDRITKTKSSGNGINHRIANVRLLLNSDFFRHFNLKVQIFDKEVYTNWCTNRFRIRLLDEVIVDFFIDQQQEQEQQMIEGGNYEQLKIFHESVKNRDQEVFDKVKDEILKMDSYNCHECHDKLTLETENISICYHCFQTSHIACMAKREDVLIPSSIECSSCSKTLMWTQVVKNSNLIKRWMTSSS